MTLPDTSASTFHKLVYASVCFVWGTTYLAIKIGVETLPPFLMGGVRFLIAGLPLLLVLKWRGAPWPTRSDWPAIAVGGVTMLAIGNGLVGWAEQWLPSGLTAVLVLTSPFAYVGLSALLGDRIVPSTWAGLALAFVGVLVLFGGDIAKLAGAPDGAKLLWPIVAVLVSTVTWAVGGVVTARAPSKAPLLMTVACQMLIGAAGQLAISAAAGEWARPLAPSPESLAALGYLVVAGSWIGFGGYVLILRTMSPDAVSLITYINTVVAVLVGWLLGSETMSLRLVAGSAVIIAGVAVVNRGLAVEKRRKAEEARRRQEEELKLSRELPKFQTQ
ncbi:MAG: EamA family transporter [Candidatus Sumerlaeia bacterium]|nr:EamA family transporter [Candidatus Sumerlaeia bacterium]